jgi:hypothetical protein
MEVMILQLTGARGAQGDTLNVLAAAEIRSGRFSTGTHFLLTDYGKTFGLPNRLSECRPRHAPEHGCLVILSTTNGTAKMIDFLNREDREAFLGSDVGDEFSIAGKAGRRWTARRVSLSDIPAKTYEAEYEGHMVDNGQEPR